MVVPAVVPAGEHVQQLQNLVAAFPYNSDGPSYNITKNRPLGELLQTGQEIRNGRQPIQCVEAVLLVLAESQDMTDLQRFALSFRAQEISTGKVNRHLVLGIYAADNFGAIGVSREPGLASKPLQFSSLADLISDYQQSWCSTGHQLQSVILSKPISHVDITSKVEWKFMSLDFSAWDQAKERLAQYQGLLEARSFVPKRKVMRRTRSSSDFHKTASDEAIQRSPSATRSKRSRSSSASPRPCSAYSSYEAPAPLVAEGSPTITGHVSFTRPRAARSQTRSKRSRSMSVEVIDRRPMDASQDTTSDSSNTPNCPNTMESQKATTPTSRRPRTPSRPSRGRGPRTEEMHQMPEPHNDGSRNHLSLANANAMMAHGGDAATPVSRRQKKVSSLTLPADTTPFSNPDVRGFPGSAASLGTSAKSRKVYAPPTRPATINSSSFKGVPETSYNLHVADLNDENSPIGSMLRHLKARPTPTPVRNEMCHWCTIA